MDSTIISAPSSTKNKEKQRDSDAHSVKKGNAWYFGYKAHVGENNRFTEIITESVKPAQTIIITVRHAATNAGKFIFREEFWGVHR